MRRSALFVRQVEADAWHVEQFPDDIDPSDGSCKIQRRKSVEVLEVYVDVMEHVDRFGDSIEGTFFDEGVEHALVVLVWRVGIRQGVA